MNIKYLIAATLLASSASLAWAIPADRRVRTMTNPDGTTVKVRVMGDEFFSFYTDADCSRILERDARGFFVDAVRDGVALKLNSDNVEMLRDEFELANPQVQAPRQKAAAQRMAALDGSGRSMYPTIGEGNHSLIVLVEFADQKFSMPDPKDFYTRMLNEPGFSDYGASGSAIDYYTATSNGLYKPTFDVYGPVTVSQPASYYNNKVNQGCMGTFIHEAVTKLYDTGQLDLSKYDLDNDGIVDTIFFYYAGHGSADSEVSSIWPHQGDYRVYTPNIKEDGKQVGPYACGNELKAYNPTGSDEPWVDGIGTFVHEYGHVLGLPDMYDANYTGTPHPEHWDVMSQGCYNGEGTLPPLFSAYEQWVCRWLEYETAEDGTHYELKPLGSANGGDAVRIRIPMSADGKLFQAEYFVIEARDNTNIWDSCFPDSGLLVWRINYNKNTWFGNAVNTYGVQNVELICAKNMKRPVFTEGSIYDGADVSLVPSKDYPLWVSPIITGIGYDASSKIASFDYNKVTVSEAYTVLNDSPLAFADGTRSFTLSWDPVEGVDSYLLTVRTVKSGSIIGGYDFTNVGNVTSATVEGLSSMYWKLELEAFVTCVVDGMRSSKNSNVITFKPSELDMDSGVDGIEDDNADVYGGTGCVFAPASAEVYTVSGQRVGRDGLVSGVYIVRCGSKTVKVIVK